LDTSNLETKRQELEAQRDAAQALLDELIKGPREETIAAARADVRALTAQVQLLETEHQRNQRLITSNAVSKKELDRTRFTKQTNLARLDAAQRRFDELEAGTRKEKIRAQQAVVAQIDAALADIAIRFKDSNLVAPFDGSIGNRYVDEGTIVSPGTHVLRLVERAGIEVWIGLPATVVAHLEDDCRYAVVIDGRSFTAALHSVLPELDLVTRTQTAIFTLKDAELGTVVPGQIARIRIAAQVQVAGFWVPTTALAHGSRGLWSVYVVEPDSTGRHEVSTRRDVEVLYTQGDRVLIRGTVSQGDRIIASGSHRVAPGQRVRWLGQDKTTIR
jgi:multidrug efflux pump subunit AcrA (membrane-fusion protein)